MGYRRRGGKTGAESAALHGYEIKTAYNLYFYLKQHHSTVSNSYDKHEFHFPCGFLGIPSRRLSQFL